MIGVIKSVTSATVSWRTAPGERYRLQFIDTLKDATWLDVSGIDITATGFTASEVDSSIGANNERYYRVQYFPAP